MLPGKKLTPADYFEMARRHVWLIVVPPMVTFFLALMYSSRVPNLYQSDMLIAIDPQRVPEGFVRSTVTLGADERLEAIRVQATSRTNLERMIETLNLYPEERKRLPMEDVVRRMQEHISLAIERAVSPSAGREGPHAFHVRFTYPDPQMAAVVTQQLGSLFVEQNVRDRRARAEATNRFLEQQLEEARLKLEAQERRLEAFRERHAHELPTQLQANMQAITSTQLQLQSLVESLARDRDRKLVLERLQRDVAEAPLPPPPTTGPNATPSPTMSAQQQLEAARATLASLEMKYKPDHPDVIRTKRLIETLEPKAAAEAASQGKSQPAVAGLSEAEVRRRERLAQMAAEIESLTRQIQFKESEEQRLRSEIAEYQRRIEAVPGLESEWIALTRDYDTQQAAYKELLAKSNASKVAVDLEQEQIGERFRIVDSAGVPVHPLPSMRVRINAIGLALGLFFGVGLAAFLEIRDRSFRTDAEILDVLGLPVLANVPYVETAAAARRRRQRTLAVAALGVVCLLGAGYVTWTMKLWNSLI